MRRTVAALLVVAGAVGLAVAGTKIKVHAEPGFEFSGYSTYSWVKGTPAPYPEIEERITAAVERELQARGLTEAEDGAGQLRVATYAFAQMTADVVGHSYWGEFWGVIRVDVNDFKEGTLWIKIEDATSEKPVWQGLAGKTVNGPREKLLPKIDKVVAKMFTTKSAK